MNQPQPGTHSYDVARTRLRDQLENAPRGERFVDGGADREANRILRGDTPHPTESAETERAGGPAGSNPDPGSAGEVLTLRSSSFSDGAFIPERYSSVGENATPEVEWEGVPQEAEELVLLCTDLDAEPPFLHWLVTGIAPSSSSPVGVEHSNGFGESGWSGPRPPVGDDAHRYVFRLYALGEAFVPDAELLEDARGLRSWLDEHALLTGTLTGLYQR